MQRNEMVVGKQYLVVRARRSRQVTLLDKTNPTLGRGYVEVEFHEGIKAGERTRVFCGSMIAMPGEEPERPQKRRRKPREDRWLVAPDDWDPKAGETVRWSKTGGIRLEVVAYDAEQQVAKVRGTILGVPKDFTVPRIELAPVLPELHAVEDLVELDPDVIDVEHERRDDATLPPPVEEEDLVDRLTFSPNVLDYYRKKFRGGCSMGKADLLLRKELKEAQLIRPRTTGDYLRLRRKGRFDVILKERPLPDDPSTTYITHLYVPPKKQGKRRRTAA